MHSKNVIVSPNTDIYINDRRNTITMLSILYLWIPLFKLVPYHWCPKKKMMEKHENISIHYILHLLYIINNSLDPAHFDSSLRLVYLHLLKDLFASLSPVILNGDSWNVCPPCFKLRSYIHCCLTLIVVVIFHPLF